MYWSKIKENGYEYSIYSQKITTRLTMYNIGTVQSEYYIHIYNLKKTKYFTKGI